MAVMQKCCCCGVRQGSIASAIYSMVLAIIGLCYFGYSASIHGIVLGTGNGVIDALLAVNVMAVIIFVFLFIACIFVLVGVSQDSKGMLIPYFVAQGLHLFWYLITLIVEAYFLSLISDEIAVYGYAYLVTIIVLIPFLIADIVCLLCVISQYQEYADGRGGVADQ